MRIAGRISTEGFRRKDMIEFLKKHKDKIIIVACYILAFICGAVIF